MTQFLPNPRYYVIKHVCRGICVTQTKYNVCKFNRIKDENCRKCSVCDITFEDCEDKRCLCCNNILRFKSKAAIEKRKEKNAKMREYRRQKYLEENGTERKTRNPSKQTKYSYTAAYREGALKPNEKPKSKPLILYLDEPEIKLRNLRTKELLSKRNTRIKRIQHNIQVWKEYIKCYEIKKETLTQYYSETRKTNPPLALVLQAIDKRIETYKQKIEKLKALRIETYIKTCIHQYEKEWHNIYSFEQMTKDITDPKFNKFDFNYLEKCPDCNQFLLPIGHKIDKQ